MIRVALRGLLGRKLRAALTAVAIVLGVAMVSGTYVLTDTIKAAFSTVFTQAYKNTDAVITGKSAISSDTRGGGPGVPSLPESLLAKVRALPQVAQASGGISDQAQLVGRDGKVISGHGAPSLAFSHTAAGARFNPLTLTSGTWPSAPNEVDIDASTASQHGFSIGQNGRCRGAWSGAAIPDRRHSQVRGRVLAGRRIDDDLHPPDRAADLP